MYIVIGMAINTGIKFPTEVEPWQTKIYATVEDAVRVAKEKQKDNPKCVYFAHNIFE